MCHRFLLRWCQSQTCNPTPDAISLAAQTAIIESFYSTSCAIISVTLMPSMSNLYVIIRLLKRRLNDYNATITVTSLLEFHEIFFNYTRAYRTATYGDSVPTLPTTSGITSNYLKYSDSKTLSHISKSVFDFV